MEVTPIGIGAWAMGGGDWAFSWGRQEDDESIAAIPAALDAGVNWIDTATVYGPGHSEEVVGKAIVGRAQRPPYVFTKCSLVWNDQREIGNSLKAASCAGTSRCLVCERLFTHEAARVNNKVCCAPAVPDLWLLNNSSSLILPLSTGA